MTATLERTEQILEYNAIGTNRLSVDKTSGIVRGVKVLGLESRNGRSYPPATLERAVGLYEGAKVNVNHPDTPKAPRAYQDRFGSLFNSRLKPDGIYADLKYNPRHSVAEQFAWDAQHNPQSCGLSHNVEAKTTWKAGKQVVETIRAVNSVDLVADPATTSGLFEAQGDDKLMPVTKFVASLSRLGMTANQLAKRGISLQRIAKAIGADRLADAVLVPLSKVLDVKPERLRSLGGVKTESVGGDEFDREAFRREAGIKTASPRPTSRRFIEETCRRDAPRDTGFDREDFRRRAGIKADRHSTTTATEKCGGKF